VERLEDVYAKARVVCCPILSGAGTRVKIIEAAAHGRPVVSTKIGAEGLEFAEGSEIILKETPSQLATACLELLLDAAKCHRIGMAAHRAAQRLYDRAQTIERIRREIEQLTGEPPASSRSAGL
jgi:glycosyltransferase involved in cell wall biosynthesis